MFDGWINDAPAMIAVFDGDMKYVALSDAYCRWIRRERAEVIGRTPYDHFLQMPERWRDAHQHCLAGVAVEAEEDTFDGENGSSIVVRWRLNPWRTAAGAIGGIVLVIENIDPEAKTRARLTATLAQLELITNNLPVLIAYIGADQRFQFANPVAEQWFARPRSQIVGVDVRDILGFVKAPDFAADIAATLSGATTRDARQVTLPDGKQRWREVIRVPDVGPDGKVRGFVVLGIDVTERVESADQLVAAQRMNAVGQLAGGLAHDLNNILGVITGDLELSLAEIPAGANWAPLDEALFAARRGADLTQSLLSFARRQTLRPQSIRVNDLTRGIAAMLGRTLGTGVEVELRLHGSPWPCAVDPAQLESAVVNLVLNARDAMPNGGRIVISTSNVTLDQELGAGGERLAPGDYVVLSVADTGGGMTPDVQARAFEPFYTTKDNTQHSGLGLATVFGFARQSGGLARIVSKTGVGTTVSIYLPREAAKPAAAPKQALPPRGAGQTVLVVEDDAALSNTLNKLLTQLGYCPVCMPDGPAALRELQGRDDVCLLLVDVVLPLGMSGFDVAQRVQEIKPNLPVIFTSGFIEPSSVPEHYLNTAIFLQKPVGRAVLADAMLNALARRRGD